MKLQTKRTILCCKGLQGYYILAADKMSQVRQRLFNKDGAIGIEPYLPSHTISQCPHLVTRTSDIFLYPSVSPLIFFFYPSVSPLIFFFLLISNHRLIDVHISFGNVCSYLIWERTIDRSPQKSSQLSPCPSLGPNIMSPTSQISI